MKTKIISLMALVMVFVLFSCFDPTPEETTGTLEFRMISWRSYEPQFNKAAANIYTCPIIDVRHLIPEIQLTRDTIYDGGAANQEWITFYESDQEMLHSERDMSGTLDTGTYRGMKVYQRNLVYWVCTHPDNPNDTLEFANWQDPDIGLNDTMYNIFGSDGLYYLNDGILYNTNETANDSAGGEGEYIGCYFKILPGKTTRVTVRMNLYSLDWYDLDGDGYFTPLYFSKDSLSNWTTFADSIITMSDFIVEYLP